MPSPKEDSVAVDNKVDIISLANAMYKNTEIGQEKRSVDQNKTETPPEISICQRAVLKPSKKLKLI